MAWKLISLLVPLSLSGAPSLDLSVTFDFSRLQSPHVSADRQGNIVVAGYAIDCSLPVVKPMSSCGSLWIARFDPTGQTLLFATYLGTPDPPATGVSVGVADIKTDRDGNIVVLSSASKSSLPVVHAIQSKITGLSNLYFCKFSADGSQLLYATYLGGTNVDSAASLYVDDSGAAYALASSSSADFPTTPQSFSGATTFIRWVVAKLSADGQSLEYASSLNWDGADPRLQVDASGSAIVVTGGAIVTLSPDGSSLRQSPLPSWATRLGPIVSPAPGGGYWLTGSVTNGLLPVTSNAFQPSSGSTPYLHVENGQGQPPATLFLAHQLNGFAVDPFERWRIYAATDGGLFKSEDNGWTWGLLNPSPSLAVAIDPFDQNTLYLIATTTGQSSFYRSPDRGQTWSGPFLSGQLTSFSIAADPNVPGLIYAPGYRSVDGGLHWQSSQLPPNPPSDSPSAQLVTTPVMERADPTHPQRVYSVAVTKCLGFCPVIAGVLESDDGGANFSGIVGMPYLYPQVALDLAVDSSTGDVFLQINGQITAYRGGNFQSSEALSVTNAVSLALDPERPGTVYASLSDGSVVSSTDAGETWSTVAQLPTPAYQLAAGDGGVLHASQQASVTDAFAFQYDPSGSPIYGTYLGGGATLANAALAAPNGHLFLAGSTGQGLPVLNSIQPQFAGGTDGFVAEFDANGTLLRSTYLGGSKNDEIDSLVLLDDGSVMLIGTTDSPDFPALQQSALGPGKQFVVRLR